MSIPPHNPAAKAELTAKGEELLKGKYQSQIRIARNILQDENLPDLEKAAEQLVFLSGQNLSSIPADVLNQLKTKAVKLAKTPLPISAIPVYDSALKTQVSRAKINPQTAAAQAMSFANYTAKHRSPQQQQAFCKLDPGRQKMAMLAFYNAIQNQEKIYAAIALSGLKQQSKPRQQIAENRLAEPLPQQPSVNSNQVGQQLLAVNTKEAHRRRRLEEERQEVNNKRFKQLCEGIEQSGKKMAAARKQSQQGGGVSQAIRKKAVSGVAQAMGIGGGAGFMGWLTLFG